MRMSEIDYGRARPIDGYGPGSSAWAARSTRVRFS